MSRLVACQPVERYVQRALSRDRLDALAKGAVRRPGSGKVVVLD